MIFEKNVTRTWRPNEKRIEVVSRIAGKSALFCLVSAVEMHAIPTEPTRIQPLCLFAVEEYATMDLLSYHSSEVPMSRLGYLGSHVGYERTLMSMLNGSSNRCTAV